MNIKYKSIVLFILTIYNINGYAKDKANEVFNLDALSLGDNSTIDQETISHFLLNNDYLPGIYLLNIYVNDSHLFKKQIQIINKNTLLTPVIDDSLIEQFGLKEDYIQEFITSDSKDNETNLVSIKPEYLDLDLAKQTLKVTIPKIMIKSDKEILKNRIWDNGIPAFFVNYYYNIQHDNLTNHKESSYKQYVNLRSGFNINQFRVRHYGIYSANKWRNINTYLFTPLNSIQSELTLGETFATSSIFPSISFLGAQLNSDDMMLSRLSQGFAPVIKGVARTQAEVTIKQNNYVIYQTTVPAGPFSIDDLKSASGDNEYTIEIKEADGEVRINREFFPSSNKMLRPNTFRYATAMGKLRNNDNNNSNESNRPYFLMGSLRYGLNNHVTFYGGTLLSQFYNSGASGAVFGIPYIGPVSLDYMYSYLKNTHNREKTNSKNKNTGHRIQLQLDHVIPYLDTRFYLNGKFYSPNFSYINDEPDNNDLPNTHYNKKNKRQEWQLGLSQNFPFIDNLSLSLSASQIEYWYKKEKENNINSSLSKNFKYFNMNVNYRYQIDRYKKHDQQVSLFISVPLSNFIPMSYLSFAYSHPHDYNFNFSGSALAENNLQYQLTSGINGNTSNKNYGGMLNYRGNYGSISSNYGISQTKNNDSRHSANINLAGGISVHQYGVTLSQTLGDNPVLVHIPNAIGTKINNHSSVKTDIFGNAIVPQVGSYYKSTISLDSSTLPKNVDIDELSQTIAPNRGAFSLVSYGSRVGLRALFTLLHDSKEVPAGAIVQLETQKGQMPVQGVVGFHGQVFLSGMPDSGSLIVNWGTGGKKQCVVNYQDDKSNIINGIKLGEYNCISMLPSRGTE